MNIVWLHEYAEQVILSGVFDDPRTVYELTPAEISATIQGKNSRIKELQRADNIRAGTICSCIYNQNRTKRNDKMWKWSDFFPEKDIRAPADQDKIKEKCLMFMKMHNEGGDK